MSQQSSTRMGRGRASSAPPLTSRIRVEHETTDANGPDRDKLSPADSIMDSDGSVELIDGNAPDRDKLSPADSIMESDGSVELIDGNAPDRAKLSPADSIMESDGSVELIDGNAPDRDKLSPADSIMESDGSVELIDGNAPDRDKLSPAESIMDSDGSDIIDDPMDLDTEPSAVKDETSATNSGTPGANGETAATPGDAPASTSNIPTVNMAPAATAVAGPVVTAVAGPVVAAIAGPVVATVAVPVVAAIAGPVVATVAVPVVAPITPDPNSFSVNFDHTRNAVHSDNGTEIKNFPPPIEVAFNSAKNKKSYQNDLAVHLVFDSVKAVVDAMVIPDAQYSAAFLVEFRSQVTAAGLKPYLTRIDPRGNEVWTYTNANSISDKMTRNGTLYGDGICRLFNNRLKDDVDAQPKKPSRTPQTKKKDRSEGEDSHDDGPPTKKRKTRSETAEKAKAKGRANKVPKGAKVTQTAT